MNSPIRKFRKFFVKPKKMNATAVRNAAASTYDEETDDTKLSGAFIIVLILHIVAVVGIVAFTRIKENRKNAEGPSVVAPVKEKKNTQSPMTVAGLGGSKVPQLAPDAAKIETPAVENNPPKILPSTGVQIHIVKQGETLTRVAFVNSTTVAELVKLNGLKGPDDLTVGQALNLPDKNSLPPLPITTDRRQDTVKTSPPRPVVPSAKPATYTIKKGDSLVGIARENGISYAELTKLNKGVDPKKIQPGQILKLPAKK